MIVSQYNSLGALVFLNIQFLVSAIVLTACSSDNRDPYVCFLCGNVSLYFLLLCKLLRIFSIWCLIIGCFVS